MQVLSKEEVRELLFEVARETESDFSGLGLIFYKNPILLPVLPLVPDIENFENLPISDSEAILQVLKKASRASSPLHDGFHLIDCMTGNLTHMAMYVAARITGPVEREGRMGARELTAQLASEECSIIFTGIVTTDLHIRIFSEGKLVWRDE